MKQFNPIIALDFDGTTVSHNFDLKDPTIIGFDIGSEVYLRKATDRGLRIILYTMRQGDHLESALKWFSRKEIPLWGVNNNPEQAGWSKSPKIYANLYVDDAALGAPLKVTDGCERAHIDWDIAGPLVLKLVNL